jgi:pyruvate decarboxylase
VTFSVGGLSAINAIGGAYAENLLVILVSGAPNSNDRATEHLIHHTLATHDWSYQFEIAKKLTFAAVSITSATEAPHQIDYAIRTALREKKPAYIEIACNVASIPCATPGPISGILSEEPSDHETLRAAIAAAAEFLHAKQKPILLIGSKLRAAGAEQQAIELAEALGCAVTVMAAAKSFFPEDHPQFAGVYWGEVNAPGAREIFDWADNVVCIGTIFNDYSTVGWTAMPSGAGVLTADQHRVYLEGHDFGRIHLRNFLSGLAREVQKRPATMVEYQRIRPQPRPEQPAKPDAKLKRTEIFRQVQALIDADTTVIAETGIPGSTAWH